MIPFKRRKHLLRRFTLLASLLVLGSAQTYVGADTPNRPDIVFILVDDLRWDGLGFKHHPYVETPNIDLLRSRGVSMNNAFVSTSICCPSRATFLTGMYANQHGVIDNESSEYNPELTPPLTKYLQQVGYKTAMLGKWHMGQNGRPREYFDHWASFKGQGKYQDQLFNINGNLSPHKGYTTDLLNNKAIKFIQQQPKGEPYFLMLSHKAVHEPFMAAARHHDAFGADTKPLFPKSWNNDMTGKPLWQRRQLVRDVRWDWRTRDAEDESIPEAIAPTAWEEDLRSLFQYRCLAAVDDGVGRILETLRERGTLENTLIVFTSDNGYFHWEHRRWDKRLAYEESMRIPMVLSFPGRIAADSTLEQLVGNIDFAPTVLDFAEIEIPAAMQGRSMKPLFEKESAPWRDCFFYEYWVDLVHEIPTTIAVRTKTHKLIHFPEIDDCDELYDLRADPHEMVNLAGDPEFSKLHSELKTKLHATAATARWKSRIFPKNLPRMRGRPGELLMVKAIGGQLETTEGQQAKATDIELGRNEIRFNGSSSRIEFPCDEDLDPATWPYEIEVEFKAEADGVVLMQSSKRNGMKIFVQDGRPGISLRCSTWIALKTTVDASEEVLGKWTKAKAQIDYNRVDFWINDKLVESRALPQPFKYRTNAPLILGNVGEHKVVERLPHSGFHGSIRSVLITRPNVGPR
ncbi:MAG: sulfatase-like hydrolase/transferase [Planctomycetota bacterium]